MNESYDFRKNPDGPSDETVRLITHGGYKFGQPASRTAFDSLGWYAPLKG